MELDLNARRNLELCETMRTKEKKGHAAVGKVLLTHHAELCLTLAIRN